MACMAAIAALNETIDRPNSPTVFMLSIAINRANHVCAIHYCNNQT